MHDAKGSCSFPWGIGYKAAVGITGAVIVIALAFYGPFLNNFFAFDDFRYIENLFSSPRVLLFGYNTTRFLSNLVFVPIYALSGYNPLGYNIFSLTLHIVNALVFAALAIRFSGKMLVGGLAGVLFVSSAALADALLWKCANNTLMSTFFSLVAFHQYLNWRETGKTWERIISLLLFVAAMFSKEDAAAFPLLIFFYELVCRNQNIQSIRLSIPYASVVVFYVITTQLLIRVFHIPLEHYERFLSFRPVYALMGGFSAFLMNPGGHLLQPGLAIITGTALVLVTIWWINDRRLILFALIGIFLTFLPSSLTSLGSFSPKYIFQSVSRYLYFPSAMAALAMALVLAEVQQRLTRRVAATVVTAIVCGYIGYNYLQVSIRGRQWYQETEPVRIFLQAMQQVVPSIPRNSYVFAIDPPVGRAYVQQSLRAFYQNPNITWIVDPRTFTVPIGASAFVIVCHWIANDNVQIEIVPFTRELFRTY